MNYIRASIIFLAIILFSLKNVEKDSPNVIVFFVDDLGWTDLGIYGSDLYQSPNIDALANEGILFTNSYSACTVCSPTRASVLTGKYPARLQLTDWIEGHKYPWAKLKVPRWKMYLDSSEYTVAEAFKDAGYHTAHFGKWHLGESQQNWPTYHGFDINIGGWKKGAPNLNKNDGLNGYFSPYGNPRLSDGPEGEHLTERLTNEICTFLDDVDKKPFFINFWLYNVHTPLQADQAKIDKFSALIDDTARHNNPTYAAMIEHTDDALGKIIQKLKKEGLYDNTIILFSSDNGGLIGNNPKKRVTNNTPLRLGKGQIYEGGVRIPTIIKTPKSEYKGLTISTPIISTDYYPTLVDLAGISTEKTNAQTLDGNSLVTLFEGEGTFTREALFWHYPHYHQQGGVPYSAVRKGNWKLIQNFDSNSYELYDLKNDIGEKENLYEKRAEIALNLKETLDKWRGDVAAQTPTINDNYNPKKKWKKQ